MNDGYYGDDMGKTGIAGQQSFMLTQFSPPWCQKAMIHSTKKVKKVEKKTKNKIKKPERKLHQQSMQLDSSICVSTSHLSPIVVGIYPRVQGSHRSSGETVILFLFSHICLVRHNIRDRPPD